MRANTCRRIALQQKTGVQKMTMSVGKYGAASAIAALSYLIYVNAANGTSTDYGGVVDGSLPFPGSEWFTGVGSEESFSWQGVTYPSVYGAMIVTKEFDAVRNFNCWINSFVISDRFAADVVSYFGSLEIGYYVVSYLRNLVSGALVYYLTSATFHYFCYVHPMSKDTFKDRIKPDTSTILDQIALAQSSMFIYVMLPVVSDWLVEENYTLCYYTFEEIGGVVPYIIWTLIYFACVEIGELIVHYLQYFILLSLVILNLLPYLNRNLLDASNLAYQQDTLQICAYEAP